MFFPALVVESVERTISTLSTGFVWWHEYETIAEHSKQVTHWTEIAVLDLQRRTRQGFVTHEVEEDLANGGVFEGWRCALRTVLWDCNGLLTWDG